MEWRQKKKRLDFFFLFLSFFSVLSFFLFFPEKEIIRQNAVTERGMHRTEGKSKRREQGAFSSFSWKQTTGSAISLSFSSFYFLKKGKDGRTQKRKTDRWGEKMKNAKIGSNAFHFPITGLHLCANQDGWRKGKRKGWISPFWHPATYGRQPKADVR